MLTSSHYNEAAWDRPHARAVRVTKELRVEKPLHDEVTRLESRLKGLYTMMLIRLSRCTI
jgi:hypothetical protein